jgi:hypothetical protein
MHIRRRAQQPPHPAPASCPPASQRRLIVLPNVDSIEAMEILDSGCAPNNFE